MFTLLLLLLLLLHKLLQHLGKILQRWLMLLVLVLLGEECVCEVGCLGLLVLELFQEGSEVCARQVKGGAVFLLLLLCLVELLKQRRRRCKGVRPLCSWRAAAGWKQRCWGGCEGRSAWWRRVVPLQRRIAKDDLVGEERPALCRRRRWDCREVVCLHLLQADERGQGVRAGSSTGV